MERVSIEQVKSAIQEYEIDRFIHEINPNEQNTYTFENDKVYKLVRADIDSIYPCEVHWDSFLEIFNNETPERRQILWFIFISKASPIQINDELQKLVDLANSSTKNKGILHEGFELLKNAIIPADAKSSQVNDMRVAYYSGAQAVMTLMFVLLDPNKEPSLIDLAKIDKMVTELRDFTAEMQLFQSN